MKKHRLRRFQADEVLATLRAPEVTVAPGVVAAATAHIELLVERLGMIARQARTADSQLAALLDKLGSEPQSAEGQPGEQRDGAILASLPGVGRTVLATLLAEASSALHSRDCQALRCLCGVAPVTKRSGKSRRVLRRRASQPRLVNATYHWSRVAAQHGPRQPCQVPRLARPRPHPRPRLRSVADRLLAVACAMLRTARCSTPDAPPPTELLLPWQRPGTRKRALLESNPPGMPGRELIER